MYRSVAINARFLIKERRKLIYTPNTLLSFRRQAQLTLWRSRSRVNQGGSFAATLPGRAAITRPGNVRFVGYVAPGSDSPSTGARNTNKGSPRRRPPSRTPRVERTRARNTPVLANGHRAGGWDRARGGRQPPPGPPKFRNAT